MVEGEDEVRITAPRLLIRFDTHPRWPPVTKGLHLDHFTEKTRDFEHSNYSLYHSDCPLILCVINYAQNGGFLLGYPIENSTHWKVYGITFWLSSPFFSNFLTKYVLESFLMCSFVYLSFLKRLLMPCHLHSLDHILALRKTESMLP